MVRKLVVDFHIQYMPNDPIWPYLYMVATGRWFSPCNLVSSTNKIDCHDMTEILLKVALNTINLLLQHDCYEDWYLVLKRKW